MTKFVDTKHSLVSKKKCHLQNDKSNLTTPDPI